MFAIIPVMMNPPEQSRALFARAVARIPGGVNSPVRAFRAVGGEPRFIARAEGPFVWDADGNRYADYVNSWGANIVGHAHPQIVAAVRRAAQDGLGFGAPAQVECEFAETLQAAMPSLEKIRAVNSGGEATMSAVRLARGFTGRDLVVKFEGCYHGAVDSLLVDAGSGALAFGNPSSAGVPEAVAGKTLVLPYNDPQAAEDAFAAKGDAVAAVIVEPVAGNMNLVAPDPEFLQTLQRQCRQHGAVLIFDEVMTGFRVHRGGAQALFGAEPDLTCLGKVIGGGLGVAAFGGRADIMDQLAPLGPVYQAGTLSGNPVALAAGLAALKIVLADGFFPALAKTARALADELEQAAEAARAVFSARAVGGMFGLFFRGAPPKNFAEVGECNLDAFRAFFHGMLKRGVYLAPSAYEAGFVSAAHTPEVVAQTARAAAEVFADLRGNHE